MAPSPGNPPSIYLWRRGDPAHHRAGRCLGKCDHPFVAIASRALGVNMFFPISGAHISPIYLAVIGFFIGILGGFFGVGGSFIAGPALRAVGLDWNFAVGTDLAHIVGKSVVAAKRHRALGNVDLKLGLIMAFGTIGGAEVGAQLIQMLKRAGNVNLVVSVVSIAVYLSISTFMIWEGRKTLRSKKGGTAAPATAAAKKHDPSSFAHVTRSIQRW